MVIMNTVQGNALRPRLIFSLLQRAVLADVEQHLWPLPARCQKHPLLLPAGGEIFSGCKPLVYLKAEIQESAVASVFHDAGPGPSSRTKMFRLYPLAIRNY